MRQDVNLGFVLINLMAYLLALVDCCATMRHQQPNGANDMTKQQSQELKRLKHELNSPKSQLLYLARRIEECSPAQGEQLMKIICRLEDWQNK